MSVLKSPEEKGGDTPSDRPPPVESYAGVVYRSPIERKVVLGHAYAILVQRPGLDRAVRMKYADMLSADGRKP